jgi:hypothetical protein
MEESEGVAYAWLKMAQACSRYVTVCIDTCIDSIKIWRLIEYGVCGHYTEPIKVRQITAFRRFLAYKHALSRGLNRTYTPKGYRTEINTKRN